MKMENSNNPKFYTPAPSSRPIFGIAIILIIMSSLVLNFYFLLRPKVKTTNNPGQSLVHNIKRDTEPILIVFTDTTDDGRPMYSAFFPDSTSMDCLFPEEISKSLNTGKWQYDNELREH